MGEQDMSPIATSLIVFACVFGGALFGMILRAVVPAHHFDEETNDVVKLGMGLLVTMTALILGLLIASAKTSYDTQKMEVAELSARIISLDRTLARYGSETKEIRNLMLGETARAIDRAWPKNRAGAPQIKPSESGEVYYEKLLELSPKDDTQRYQKAQALSLATDIRHMRWLMFAQRGSSFSMLFLVAVVSWLTIIFISLGLFAPRNTTVIVTLFVCGLAVSGAILMILELDTPFEGLLQISPDQLRSTLMILGQ